VLALTPHHQRLELELDRRDVLSRETGLFVRLLLVLAGGAPRRQKRDVHRVLLAECGVLFFFITDGRQRRRWNMKRWLRLTPFLQVRNHLSFVDAAIALFFHREPFLKDVA